MSRAMMPRALPSTMMSSSISWRVYVVDRAGRDLALERLVGADQQLLAGLAAGVEGARDLHAAEGAVVEQAAVLAGERDALRDALVDDVGADLGQAVDVRLARAVVAALDRVVEEAVDGVAVLLVVLRGVDAALGGDRVRAARGVLVAEGLHVVAGLAERGGGRGAGQAGADDDDVELAAVGRVDQAGLELAVRPALGDRAGRAPWCRRAARRACSSRRRRRSRRRGAAGARPRLRDGVGHVHVVAHERGPLTW